MNAQVITTEYAEQWPLQPWAAVVRTASEAGAADVAAPVWAPSTGTVEAAPAGSRRGGDRGASAVEWVVITAIAVAIVGLAGGIIYNAVQTKANKTNEDIQGVNPTSTN